MKWLTVTKLENGTSRSENKSEKQVLVSLVTGLGHFRESSSI